MKYWAIAESRYGDTRVKKLAANTDVEAWAEACKWLWEDLGVLLGWMLSAVTVEVPN